MLRDKLRGFVSRISLPLANKKSAVGTNTPRDYFEYPATILTWFLIGSKLENQQKDVKSDNKLSEETFSSLD